MIEEKIGYYCVLKKYADGSALFINEEHGDHIWFTKAQLRDLKEKI